MEEAWYYSSNGREPRAEYAPLSSERKLGAYLDISDIAEALFEQEDHAGIVCGEYSADSKSVVRELSVQNESLTVDDETLWADSETGAVKVFRPPVRNLEKRLVTLRHEVYRSGAKLEEYTVAIDSTVEGTTGDFFALYALELYAGGGVQMTVCQNNVSPYEDVEGATEERAMTEYDVISLEKELSAMHSFVQSMSRNAALTRAYRLTAD